MRVPHPGGARGQDGWGSEQPDVVEVPMDTWLQLGGLQGPFQPKLFCHAVIPAGCCLWAHLTRLLLGNVSVPKSSWVWGFWSPPAAQLEVLGVMWGSSSGLPRNGLQLHQRIGKSKGSSPPHHEEFQGDLIYSWLCHFRHQ